MSSEFIFQSLKITVIVFKKSQFSQFEKTIFTLATSAKISFHHFEVFQGKNKDAHLCH